MAPSAIEIIEQYAPIILNKRESLINEIHINHGTKNAKQIVHDALKKRVNTINTDACEAGEEDAFFVADMGEVYRQHLRWKMNLKRVKPHYGEWQPSSSPRARC